MPRSCWTPAVPLESRPLLGFRCVGFPSVNTVADCLTAFIEAVSSFRACGRPYGLWGSLPLVACIGHVRFNYFVRLAVRSVAVRKGSTVAP
jgi:hypothetical protein